jgi:hypothetical protein
MDLFIRMDFGSPQIYPNQSKKETFRKDCKPDKG